MKSEFCKANSIFTATLRKRKPRGYWINFLHEFMESSHDCVVLTPGKDEYKDIRSLQRVVLSVAERCGFRNIQTRCSFTSVYVMKKGGDQL